MKSETAARKGSRMDEIVADLPTKAAKIRALDEAGYSRSEIAGYLGIRYQHVYNVLARRMSDHVPEQLTVSVGPGGRIVIPAAYRRAMGVGEGDDLLVRLEEGEVRMISRAAAIRRAQELVRRYFPGDERLSDLLIAERRAEAAREELEE